MKKLLQLVNVLISPVLTEVPENIVINQTFLDANISTRIRRCLKHEAENKTKSPSMQEHNTDIK